jgi:hypothetical protein
MFFIPGWLIAFATFPGIIVHEAGHVLFCRLRKVAVLKVCYLRFANPPGYVIHETPGNFTSQFLISVGPFILNTFLCLLICFPAFIRVRTFNMGDGLSYLLLWLGVSIGMHAFPSNQDAKGLWNASRQAIKKLHPLALISFPLVIVIFVANALRIVWADYLYGFAVGLLLPELILKKTI